MIAKVDDARLARWVKVLVDEGCAPGHAIHSWRCEYEPCDCLEEMARELMRLADSERGDE